MDNAPNLFSTAKTVADFFSEQNYSFCIIGGMALMRWGSIRFTRDVDLSLWCPFGSEDEVVHNLLAKFEPRTKDAHTFAVKNRVVLVKVGNTPVDISLAAIPYEERCLDRSSDYEFVKDLLLPTCSAEDLMITKTFAGRPQDWADVESVINAQKKLNWATIESELIPLLELKEASENYDRLLAIKKEFARHE